MKLSKKLQKEIKLAIGFAFDETLELKEGHNVIHGSRWFDNAPDTWSKEQTELYQLMMEFQYKATDKVLSLFSNSNNS